MHQPVNSPTRPFVPFFLNGRIWRYHFAPWKNGHCLDQLCVEIPMKFFPKPGDLKWIPRQVFVTFEKLEYQIKASIKQRPKNCKHNNTVILADIGDKIPVTEIQYVCRCDKMFYGKDGLPVVR